MYNSQLVFEDVGSIGGSVQFRKSGSSPYALSLVYGDASGINTFHQLINNNGTRNWVTPAELNDMKDSFQDGVDTLYNKCKSCGATPSAKTPTAISTAIQSIYTNRYNAGYSAGQTAYKPTIKEGTGNATRNATSYSLNVTIPKGLTYVCAGITGVQDASGYDDSANWKLWSVSTSWSYNSSTGVVSFSIGVGGGTYQGSNAKISYKIMYVS